ncbi:hypothetical protein BDP81DRAFT_419578 [Colletotrichum phormii]|uniref:Uncharacterized protein n=1 Tax=Colletotrichum phormii TaxID=359342 RepID=A0AAI9ZXU0_9PEZI|nr:uncharacterized protein BDP81DRAFT_419578 [Colletotrichum phormii]KAK1640219.1 hypothetical protein BDP81DRAFT_419578 [Colletotrichum phormii]
MLWSWILSSMQQPNVIILFPKTKAKPLLAMTPAASELIQVARRSKGRQKPWRSPHTLIFLVSTIPTITPGSWPSPETGLRHPYITTGPAGTFVRTTVIWMRFSYEGRSEVS